MDIEAIERAASESEILEFLIQSKTLEGAALGIAKQVLDKGTDSLRGGQHDVYQNVIVPHFSLDCSRCGIPMPTCEVVHALIEMDELCSWCRHMESKLDDDD